MTILPRPAPRTRGAAALTVVMVLLSVMAMAAVYANRALLHEQRMSINDLRATAASAAADAGLDWAVAMLNGARVDASCTARDTPHEDDADLRSRYTDLQADGSYAVPSWATPPGRVLRPACAWRGDGWRCTCPDAASPATPAAAGSEPTPVFAVEIASGGRPGVLQVDAWGGHDSPGTDPSGASGAFTRLRVQLGLVRALPAPPVAALSAGNSITVRAAAWLRAANTDAATGVALRAGNGIDADPSRTALAGPAGSLADAARLRVDADSPLKALSDGSLLFRSLFGTDAETFRRQPGAAFVDCRGGCDGATVAAQLAKAPGRVVWVEGDLVLDAAGTLGSASRPAVIVASGDLVFAAPVAVTGFVYARDVRWQAGAAGGVVRGALFAERDFVAEGDVAVAYDADVLRRISHGHGSFVKVPGSWQVVRTR